MAKPPIWIQTKREKVGQIDGINLFFGALLGANLGTLGTLPLFEYLKLIVLLAGMVVMIRIASASERRGYALASLGLYVALFAAILLVPDLQPEGLAQADINRLGATLIVWVGTTLLVEFWPTHESAEEG